MEDSRSRVIQAVLFDLDGTLIDTSPDFIHVVNGMLVADGQPQLPERVIRDEISNGSPALVTLAYGWQPEDPKFEPLRQRLLNTFQSYTSCPERPMPTLFDGMEELLGAIEDNDILWGIVTNKPRALAEQVLNQLNLSQRCSVLICPEDVTRSKPDPQGLWLAAEALDCAPESCIYVGDHERDIQAGQAAAMITVAALYGFIPANEDPKTWRADLQIETPLELLDWLDDCEWHLPEEY